jgi:hypothetical protein
MRYDKSERRKPRDKKKPDAAPAHDDWRDRRDEAQAKLSMLELKEREGSLVRRDLTERAAKKLASELIVQLSPIPDRIAAEFGQTDDEKSRIRRRIADEINAVRAVFARNEVFAGA